MTATYVLSTLIGQVRLRIGDTDTTDTVFTDEELQVFLDANSDSVPFASAMALEAWATKYGANADSEEIGNYRYDQKIVNNLLKMAKQLRATAAEGPPVLEYGTMDLSGNPLVDD